MKARLLGAAALGLLVAACGTDPRERTTGGAAAGAATGAGVGALGGPVGALAGAAIGGGVGAVTGAVTAPSDVNLGRPVWENPETRVPGVSGSGSSGRSGSAASGGSSANRQAQQALNSRGYDAGPADGRWGARSRAATENFQRANGLPVTGQIDSRTAQALSVGGGTGGTRTAQQSRDRAYQGGGMPSSPSTGSMPGTATGSPGSSMPSSGGGTGAPPPGAMPPNATGAFGGPGNNPSGPGPGNTGGGQMEGGGGTGR